MHVVTVVGCEPHEVGSRSRVEIIDERTVSHRTAARVGENNLGATRRTVHNVGEPDERVMLRSIRLMITQVTAACHVLVLHVALPGQARCLKTVYEVGTVERPRAACRAAVVRGSAQHSEIVSLAVMRHAQIVRSYRVAIGQARHVWSAHSALTGRRTRTAYLLYTVILHNDNHDMVKIGPCSRRRLCCGTRRLCDVRDVGNAQSRRQEMRMSEKSRVERLFNIVHYSHSSPDEHT